MGKAAIKANIPKLDNATPGHIIDEIARLRAEQKALKQLEGIYTEALKGRFPKEYATGCKGDLFVMNPRTSVQERIDSAKVRELLSEEDLKKVIKEVEMTQLIFTALPKE